MAKTADCWGLEVGVSALKAIRLVRSGGQVQVADYEVIPHKQVLTTPDVDVDEAIQLALDALTHKHDLSKSKVVVAVPGNRAFARFAKLPPVEPKKIPDIVRFEAVQQIPFPIDQVEWDYQTFQHPESPDVEVGIFAITKERVAAFLRNYRAVGINVEEVSLSPVAVYNAFAYEGMTDENEHGAIIMDIGGVSTDLIIVEGGTIWLRTLPIGGANFTEALSKAFKLSHRKAEKLKREAATSKYARQIFQAMRPVFSDLVQEVQKSLGYYQSLNRDSNVTRIIGLGSTFRLPGLPKFLKQQLQMDVGKAGTFKKLTVEGKREADFADQALNLATAYGLALQGLHLAPVHCNLLPRHIRKIRMWKSKQPWFAAAAVCLLLAGGLAFYNHTNTSNQWRQRAQEVDQRYNAVVGRATNLARQWDEIRRANDPRQQIENVRAILDYRDVWTGVLKDVSLALDTYALPPALFRADYDAIAALGPNQRRRLFIERIETTFLPGGDGASTEIDDYQQAGRFWPQDGSDARAPGFEIRVQGFIQGTQRSTAQFLSAGVIDWLENNTNRPDRPYTIDLPGRIIQRISLRQVDSGAAAAAPTRGGRGRTGGRRGGGGATGSISSWEDLRPFLPDDPLPDLIDSPVSEFVVSWTIRLRPPEEARDPAAAVAEDREEEQAPPGSARIGEPTPRTDERGSREVTS